MTIKAQGEMFLMGAYLIEGATVRLYALGRTLTAPARVYVDDMRFDFPSRSKAKDFVKRRTWTPSD